MICKEYSNCYYRVRLESSCSISDRLYLMDNCTNGIGAPCTMIELSEIEYKVIERDIKTKWNSGSA